MPKISSIHGAVLAELRLVTDRHTDTHRHRHTAIAYTALAYRRAVKPSRVADIQKMFSAESIVFDDAQRQNHVYNLLVALKHLSDNQPCHCRDEELATKLPPQRVIHQGSLIYYSVSPKKVATFLFFQQLCEKLTDFNDFWCVES